MPCANRLVTAINATAQTSALVSAVNGGSGEILLTGKTAGQTIAVYFDTGGADVLTQELIHRAVPANENMIPGYVPEGGYSNANFAVNVVHQAEWFRNTDPGTGAGTSLSAADGNYSSEIEDSLPLSLDASGWPPVPTEWEYGFPMSLGTGPPFAGLPFWWWIPPPCRRTPPPVRK